MKKVFLSILVLLIIITGIYFFINKPASKNNTTESFSGNSQSEANLRSGSSASSIANIINNDNFKSTNMKLISSAFKNNQYIPEKYTCDGININPPLSITGTPEEAKSLVLIIDDPDAPNGDWVHWTVLNMPPDTKEIKEGVAPSGSIESRTNFKKPGYGGPCPPSGIHHYQFKLYALDAVLNLDSSASKKEIEKAMSGHILAEDLLVGLYKRN